MRHAQTLLIGLALSLCAPPASPAAEYVVLDATPSVRVVSTDKKTVRTVLSKQERAQYRVKVVCRDGRYYLASRDNLELMHSQGGAFHLFTPTGGKSGYLKVCDSADLPGADNGSGPRVTFMEHVTAGFMTITYWGTCEGLLLGAPE